MTFNESPYKYKQFFSDKESEKSIEEKIKMINKA